MSGRPVPIAEKTYRPGRLRELEGVADAAVVGLPDGRLGEVPVAYVLRAPGAEFDEETLLAHVRGRVASFKVPRHVLVVGELPMTPTARSARWSSANEHLPTSVSRPTSEPHEIDERTGEPR
jgi:acyl-CoA synthetase (AMP-forming)/AMP-acid ligase II